MAKKNKKRQFDDPRTKRYKPKDAPTQERPHFYTQDGRKVHIKTISVMDVSEAEGNIRAEYAERVKVPQYQTITAGGAVLYHDLNEKILVVEGDEEETKRRQMVWAEHINTVNEMEAEIAKTTLAIIMDGIDESPPDDWIAQRKARHLSVPGKDIPEDEKILFWKTAVLLRNNVADILEGQTEILVLATSGAATREDIEAAGSIFPDQLPGDEEIEADTAEEPDRDTNQEKGLTA